MSVYENVRFAQIGYSAVFDKEKKCFSSDDNELMRRLEKQAGIRTAMKINLGNLKSFEHRFSYRKIRYRATFTPFHERFYLCRVYPEDCYMKHAYSELYKSISDIRMNAAEMICSVKKLDERLISINAGELRSYTSFLLSSAEKEYACATEILGIFDKQHIFEYIPIVKYLAGTAERIKKNNAIIGKRVILETTLNKSVARVNHILLEAAVSCIVKFFYKILQKDEEVLLRITGTDSGELRMKADFESKTALNIEELGMDIGLIRCVFEALDGKAVIDIDGNKISLRGEVPVSLSNYFNRIKGIYEEFDENELYDPEQKNILNAPESDKNKYYALHSRKSEYREDLLELIWNIAMNSFYEEIIA